MAMAESIIEETRAALEPMGIAITQLNSLTLSLPEEDMQSLKAAARAAAMARVQPNAQPQAAPLNVGARVMVPWNDGNRYPGTIRRFENGYFEIVWDNNAPAVWLLPHQVQRA
jgi:hypothetical protein